MIERCEYLLPFLEIVLTSEVIDTDTKVYKIEVSPKGLMQIKFNK